MTQLKNKCVILGISGGIAAYKMANVASALVKMGADVHVLMTANATQFITPLTFETLTKHKCLIDTFDRNFEYDVQHISLAKKADLILIAPATADIIAKMANGIADDMLTTVVLAATCKKLFAPSMNTAMLENPITQDNIAKLIHYGFSCIEPESGLLACKDVGKGKLPEPEVLVERICHEIAYEKDLQGVRICVTAGPTREALDPVRFLTNYSSGKMGYAIAKRAAMRGADVTLISGPVNLDLPYGVQKIAVESAEEMFTAVKEALPKTDILIKAAAVADYTPQNVADQKMKKSDQDLVIPLKRTQDILKYCGEHKQEGLFLCGFSMETQDMVENSRKKLVTKNLDMIAANNVKVEGAGFGVDTNILTLITAGGSKELPQLSKEDAAGALLDEIKAARAKSMM